MKKLALALSVLLLTLALAACSTEANNPTFAAPNGVSVSVGALAETVVKGLGTPLSKNETASCGGIPGNDCVYTYAGFRIKTTPAKGGDIVCQIELTDDSVKTPEGLYIGMTVDAAKSILSGMGTCTAVGEGFSCTVGNTKLQVTARDGVVSGIAYLEA